MAQTEISNFLIGDIHGCTERRMQEKQRSIFWRGNREQMLLGYFHDQDNPEIMHWVRF